MDRRPWRWQRSASEVRRGIRRTDCPTCSRACCCRLRPLLPTRPSAPLCPGRNVRPRLGERQVNLPPLVDPAALDLNVAIERAPPILDLAPAICPLTEYLLRGLSWDPLIRVRVEEDERFWTVALSGNTVAAVGAEYERRLRQSRCESGCPGQQGCDAGVRRRCRLWRDGERLDDRETLDASDLNDEPPKEENLDDTGRPPTLAVGFEQTGGADDGTSSEDEAPSAGAGAPAAGGSMEDPSSDSSGEDTPLEAGVEAARQADAEKAVLCKEIENLERSVTKRNKQIAELQVCTAGVNPIHCLDCPH